MRQKQTNLNPNSGFLLYQPSHNFLFSTLWYNSNARAIKNSNKNNPCLLLQVRTATISCLATRLSRRTSGTTKLWGL